MHILITGAAGMVGRKLTERLVAGRRAQRQGRSTGSRWSMWWSRTRPPGFPARSMLRARYRARGRGPQAGRRTGPDVIFHLAAVVSGEAEADFEKGYRINLVPLSLSARSDPLRGRRLSPEARVHLVDRGVRRAVPERDLRRFPSHAAHLLRHAEGHLRAAAGRLHAQGLPRRRRHPSADHLRAAGQAEQGRVGLLLQHHPRAARRPGGGAAGRRKA